MTEISAGVELDMTIARGQSSKVTNSVKTVLSDHARDIAQRLADRPISSNIVKGVVRAIELLIIFGTGFALCVGYSGRGAGADPRYLVPLVVGSFLAVTFIQIADGYNFASFHKPAPQIERIVIAWSLVFAGFAMLTFLLKQSEFYSRVWFVAWYVTGLASLVLFRAGLAIMARHWIQTGRLQRRAVIVGGGKDAAELIRTISGTPDNDIQICGIFDDRADERSAENVEGHPRLGSVAELVDFGRIAKIDMLIVSLPITAENRLLQILQQLWVLPVDIRLSAYTHKLRFRPRSYTYIGPVPFLDVFDKPIADWDSIGKRVFDLVIAGFALVCLLPVLMIIAIAIKLDSRGPVLFRQKRYGFNNEIIDVFKFRSMYADKCDYQSKLAVTKGDPRVTRVGRFIRKTSLDELPQLFNVLRGSLSLVGPRPHAIGSNTRNNLWETVVDGYFARHKVKPGVTGWAQINGWRGEVDTSEKLHRRVEHDLYYIENWSTLLDLYILFRTPLALLNTKNAY